MKWFKFVILLVLFTAILTFVYIPPPTTDILCPLSLQNSIYKNFNTAFTELNLPIKNCQLIDFNQQLNCQLSHSQIIFSTNKNQKNQLMYLQQLLSIAKIKHSQLVRVNFSSKRPYATFQTY